MNTLPYSTTPIPAAVASVLENLRPGQKLRITQNVRVGSTREWQAVVTGTFRHLDSLATGIATHRVPEDDIIIPIVHFTKDNGELSSIAIDQHTKIEVVG